MDLRSWTNRRACEFYFTPELLARRGDIVDLVGRITAETPARRIWPSFQKLIDIVERKVELDLPDHAEPGETGFPIWKHLRNIKAPTLILQGYGDQLIHRDCAQADFEQIPNAELRLFKPFRHSFSGNPEIQRQQADWIWIQETARRASESA
jgi:alpha-beta hydrolase superfamily lysophospholipase